MTSNWGHPGLSPRQRTRLEQLYPEAHGIADHSWPYGITVLEFIHARRRLLLKACESPHHLDRESRAHRSWLRPLANDVPELVGYDADAGLLVKTFMTGSWPAEPGKSTTPECSNGQGNSWRACTAGPHR